MLDVDTNPAANSDDMNILVVGSRSSRCLVICVILAHIELHFTRENTLLRYVVSMFVMHMSIYAELLLFV